jgi:hypothetical protein
MSLSIYRPPWELRGIHYTWPDTFCLQFIMRTTTWSILHHGYNHNNLPDTNWVRWWKLCYHRERESDGRGWQIRFWWLHRSRTGDIASIDEGPGKIGSAVYQPVGFNFMKPFDEIAREDEIKKEDDIASITSEDQPDISAEEHGGWQRSGEGWGGKKWWCEAGEETAGDQDV